MVDNIKPTTTKIGTTSYVKGKPVATSTSDSTAKPTEHPVDSMLSESLERVIKSLQDDSGDINDEVRVNALKGQLRQGTYVVDSKQLANDMLQEYPPALVSADNSEG